jgi:ribosomal protein L40E
VGDTIAISHQSSTGCRGCHARVALRAIICQACLRGTSLRL